MSRKKILLPLTKRHTHRQALALGYPVNEEDKARLSPLIHEHVNTQGRHSFVMPEAVVKGNCARCETRPMIRTEAITASGPCHKRKTYVPRSPYRSGLPRFSVHLLLKPLFTPRPPG